MNEFKKVHTTKDLTLTTIILAIGIVVVFFNKAAGVCLMCLALLMFLIYKTGYRNTSDGNVYSKRSLDLCRGGKESLMDFLNGRSDALDIKEGSEGGCIRIDVYSCKNTGESIIQVYNFANYEYEPMGEPFKLNCAKTKQLIAAI